MEDWSPGDGEDPTPHMRVYEDRVEFIDEEGSTVRYRVGTQTTQARDRYERINRELESGYLRDQISAVLDLDVELDITLDERHCELIDEIVEAITGERGRAIAGLTVGQLTIKSIAPEQSIRLHKGSRSSAHFGWEEGLSMRSIDSNHIAPALRESDLLRVNKDGVMMTRSLAENYPYSQYYQANIRGAQEEWGQLIEAIEGDDRICPESALRYLLTSLANRGERAEEIYEEALESVEAVSTGGPSRGEVRQLIRSHIRQSSHSARIYEVALHSLYQVLDERNLLDGTLKPLTQMRSADKKHGNVGDIEVVDPDDEFHIYQAWDAKYGKPELYSELHELDDKLDHHPETRVAGFVTNTSPAATKRIEQLRTDLETKHDVEIKLLSFKQFSAEALDRLGEQMIPPVDWLRAYTETLSQRRRDRAPIDEPTQQWVADLNAILDQK